MQSELLVGDESGVRTVTLNRPERRNALSTALMRELVDVLDETAARDDVAVLVVRGAGPLLSTGHDLQELADRSRAEYAALFELADTLFESIRGLPQPTIAQVHGFTAGAGLQLVTACDLAIAADDAELAAPGVRIGLLPSPPMAEVSRAMQRTHALDLLLTGEPIGAHDALERGLVSRVVAASELDAAVAAVAARIASFGPRTVRLGKEAFYRQLELPRASAHAYLRELLLDHLADDEAREGIGTFLARRERSG